MSAGSQVEHRQNQSDEVEAANTPARFLRGWSFNRKMTVLSAWQSWHHGDESTPPLKLLEHWDLSDNRVVNGKTSPIRETESRYLGFMKNLCEELDRAGRRSPAYSELVTLYNSSAVHVPLPATTTELNQNRARHANELNWRYSVEVMKDEKKRRTDSDNREEQCGYAHTCHLYLMFFTVINLIRVLRIFL